MLKYFRSLLAEIPHYHAESRSSKVCKNLPSLPLHTYRLSSSNKLINSQIETS